MTSDKPNKGQGARLFAWLVTHNEPNTPMKHVRELSEYLNREALLTTDGMQVTVRIINVRQVFSRVDCQVTPMNGSGSSWVSADRLMVIGLKKVVVVSDDKIVTPQVEPDWAYGVATGRGIIKR